MTRRTYILHILAFVILFAAFAFTRFYNIHNRIIIDWDQEQFINQIKDIVVNHKFTLLGPRVVGPQGFFLAPYFTYLLVPFFLATKLHPWALLYFIVLYNIFFFFAAFFIVRKLFNFWYALSFLAFWTSGYLFINYDSIPWWPVLIPTGILLTFFLLYRIYNRGKLIDWILLGVSTGFFMNMHFQFVFMILFIVSFLVFWQKAKKKIEIRYILSLGVPFIIMFLPLFLFDLRHNFLNMRLFLNFFTTKGAEAFNPVAWIIVLANALQPFTYFKEAPFAIVVYFLILYILRQLSLRKKGFHRVFYQASLVLWVSIPLFFVLYGKRPSEYYFIFIYPIMIIGLVDFLVTVKKTFVIPILFAIFLLVNIPQIPHFLDTNYYGLFYKDLLVRKIVQRVPPNYKFNISFDVWPNGDTGFRYLFDWYHIRQSGNMRDALIQIRTQTRHDGDEPIGGFTLLLPKDLRD